jgi:hypothetical protein
MIEMCVIIFAGVGVVIIIGLAVDIVKDMKEMKRRGL